MAIRQRRRIIVGKPYFSGNDTLMCDVSAAGLGRLFLSEQFFATYNVDIKAVPEALGLIPVTANLAPIAWALDAELVLPSGDTGFLNSLNQVKDGLRQMYPEMAWEGTISPREVVDCSSEYVGTNVAMLYSGGVDSLATLLDHKDEKPMLVTVWGADLALDREEGWKTIRENTLTVAQKHGLPAAFVKSNFRTFFDEEKLSAKFARYVSTWWSGVQHGLGLLGLCAPLSYAHGLRSLYIASSQWPGYPSPWGSDPLIDNRVRWGGTRCFHDGYHLSRQRKISKLADYLNTGGKLDVRACYGSADGTNCSRCEKCCRTMVGLMVAGINPEDNGFNMTPATLSYIRTELERGGFPLEAAMWQDIQCNIPSESSLELEGLTQFFAWLKSASMEQAELLYRRRNRVRSTILRTTATLPWPARRFVRALGRTLNNFSGVAATKGR